MHTWPCTCQANVMLAAVVPTASSQLIAAVIGFCSLHCSTAKNFHSVARDPVRRVRMAVEEPLRCSESCAQVRCVRAVSTTTSPQHGSLRCLQTMSHATRSVVIGWRLEVAYFAVPLDSGVSVVSHPSLAPARW
uniref:Putative secreted protein n=1 Tax=Amblyomma cajennense TaxID=34607 RepID=A0A023FE20_AMBCJ